MGEAEAEVIGGESGNRHRGRRGCGTRVIHLPGPSGNEEKFTNSRWYTVVDQGREHRVLVALTDREAWGRTRKRAVAFRESGSSFYPWTEFVETDDGRYAAGISDPDHPRALLKEGAAIPDRFRTARIERTDQLFKAVRRGPSLRLVLA